MQQDRTPRGAEPRTPTAVSRTRPARPQVRGAFPMQLDLGPDVSLRYVRTHFTASTEDKMNFGQSKVMGWEPVTMAELEERHPEMAVHADENGHIRIGGTILCKNSVETVQESIQEAEQQAIAWAEEINSDFTEDRGDGITTEVSSKKTSSTRTISKR